MSQSLSALKPSVHFPLTGKLPLRSQALDCKGRLVFWIRQGLCKEAPFIHKAVAVALIFFLALLVPTILGAFFTFSILSEGLCQEKGQPCFEQRRKSTSASQRALPQRTSIRPKEEGASRKLQAQAQTKVLEKKQLIGRLQRALEKQRERIESLEADKAIFVECDQRRAAACEELLRESATLRQEKAEMQKTLSATLLEASEKLRARNAKLEGAFAKQNSVIANVREQKELLEQALAEQEREVQKLNERLEYERGLRMPDLGRERLAELNKQNLSLRKAVQSLSGLVITLRKELAARDGDL